MAWIRADVTNKFTRLNVNNISTIEKMLDRKLYESEITSSINLSILPVKLYFHIIRYQS